jgi:hypothetical protein
MVSRYLEGDGQGIRLEELRKIMKITSEQIVNVIEVQASAAPICWV